VKPGCLQENSLFGLLKQVLHHKPEALLLEMEAKHENDLHRL